MSTKLTDSDGDEVLVDQSQFTTWNRNLQLRARAKNYLGLLTGNEVVIQETPIPVRPTKPKTRAATDDGSYQELAEEYKLDVASYRLNHDRYEKYATRKRECVAWLYQKVHHAISGSVEETDDPKILYEAIQAQCKMTDSRALDHALNEYERTKLRFCSSMSDYLCKLEIARLDIRSLTSPSNITDTEFKSKIIRGLGNGYEDFVKHYQRVQDDPSVVNGTIKTLKSQLLSEEALVNAAKTKKDKDKDKDKNKGGRTSGSKKSGDKSDDDRKKLECCGRWGNHTEEECWVKHPEIKPDWAKEKEKNKDKDSNKDDKKKDFNKEKSAGHAGVVTGDETCGCNVEVYANHRFGLMCRDAVVEGVPCYPCMVRNLDNEKGQPGRCCRILSKDELQVEEIFCAYFKVVHDKDGAPKVVRNLAVPNNSVPINHYNVESNYYHGKKGKKSDKPLSSSDDEEFQEPDQPSAASRLNSFKFAGLATDALQATGVSMEDIENATSMVSFTIPSDASTRPVPQNFKEVQACPPDERRNWEQSDQAEIDSLRENKTFDLINKVPAGKRALSTRMVRRRKINSDGTPKKYKSRLVARGFQQKEGFDFTETYSGVVKTAAYRLLFALTAALGWTCHQMDFVTAFLNGELDEEVYIRFPDGLPGLSGRLAKLRKGLYGLKQAPRVWYTKLRVWLQQHDWTISQFDECVFFHKDRGLVMTVYVDDVNIFGANEEAVALCKKELSSAFKMTDEGQVAYYLGMQIEHSKEGIHIHQGTYIAQILERYGLADVTPVATPLDPSKVLVQSTGQASQAFITEYLSKVGSLNYLSSKTRADLACAISVVASFQTNPDQTHMDAVHHIFAYLKGCPRAGLFFRRNGSVQLQGFVDSDWAACKDTRRSRTGWLYQIAGAPISFSQRQKVVATSSTEAEYVAASDAAREAIWLRGFLNEIAFNLRETDIHQDAIRLHIDNASAVKLSKNPELHSRTKHIDIRHHFLRETVLRGEIQPEWISGKENPADLLTKQLPKFTFEKHFQGMGM